ncbi:MAG: diguanylate cyclase [Pseudomonadota bacterium]
MKRYGLNLDWLRPALVLVLAAILAFPTHADRDPVLITDADNAWTVDASNLELATKIPLSASPNDVLSGAFDQAFAPPAQDVPKRDGYGEAVWGRVTLTHAGDQASHISLVVKYPQLDQIEWFVRAENGAVETSVGGQFVARPKDQIASRFPLVSTQLAPGETKQVYFRINSETVLILPFGVYRTSTWVSLSIASVLIFGLLIGCLLTMSVLGLIAFFGARHWSSLWFSVFCVASAGYILTASGMDKAYLWPGRTGDYLFLLFVFQGLGMAATALFVDRFLKTKSNAPTLFRLLRVQAGFAVLTCFTSPLPMWLAIVAFTITMALGPLVILIGVVSLWRKRAPGAGLVVLSWIPSQLGAFWIFLRAIDVAPYSDINHYALPVLCTLTAIAFIWALHRQNAESAHRASHDLLTGLPNRFAFEQAVARASGQRERPLAVMQIDLDGFKTINDTYGHAAGDVVLQDVAARLQTVCAPAATPFRNGGDEFIVLCLKRTRRTDVETLAQQIIDQVSKPIDWRGRDLCVGASVGIAFPSSGGGRVFGALEEADAALYAAKQNGKGCVVLAPSHSDPAKTSGLAA